jgi:hypothetical protein
MFRLIPAHNPEVVGKVENAVKTIKLMCAKSLSAHESEWNLFYHSFQLWFNLKVKQVIGCAPFTLMFARTVNLLTDYSKEIIEYDPTSIAWKKHIEKVVSLIYPAVELRARGVREEYIQHLDELRHAQLKTVLLPETPVRILEASHMSGGVKQKLGTPRFSTQTYFIIGRLPSGAYKVRDENGVEHPRSFAIQHLKVLRVYHPHADDSSIWIVDKIIDRRGSDPAHYEYLIKWRGSNTNTWEPAKHIHDLSLIREFEERRKYAHAPSASTNASSASSSSNKRRPHSRL